MGGPESYDNLGPAPTKGPRPSGSQRTTTNTSERSSGSDQGRQADPADLGGKGSQVQILSARPASTLAESPFGRSARRGQRSRQGL